MLKLFFRDALSVGMCLTLLGTAVNAETIVVDGTLGPIFTIAEAISLSDDGDTIEIRPGTYSESLTCSNRRLSLMSSGGADVTILDGLGQNRILRLIDADLTISGLSFVGGVANCGGAIAAVDSDLRIEECVFRKNVAGVPQTYQTQGGAIFLAKDSRLQMLDTVLVDNHVTAPRGTGPAVSYSNRDWASDGYGGIYDDMDVRIEMKNCSFLYNTYQYPRQGTVVHIDRPAVASIDRCLFVGEHSHGTFVNEGRSGSGDITMTCSLEWDSASPQLAPNEVDGKEDGFASQNESRIRLDPRICPEDREAAHESSPLFSHCGGIGATPMSCEGPEIFAVQPNEHLSPRADQVVRVYGYGLDGVDHARLVHSDGTVVESSQFDRADTWLWCSFDMIQTRSGHWSLQLLDGSNLVAEKPDAFLLNTLDPRRFRPSWIKEETARNAKLAMGETRAGLHLSLASVSGGLRIPLHQVTVASVDTLEIELPALPPGLYDLVITGFDGEEYRTPSMLRVGQPPIRRVPEDYATIGLAVRAADPGDEIRVAPGTYPEPVVVDRPVRIVGESERAWETQIDLDGLPGHRGIHILPSAGRVVEIDRLMITDARPGAGPGAGIYSEVPFRLIDSWVARCSLDGPKSLGGGVWAAPGSEIVRSRFLANSVFFDGEVESPNPFVDPKPGTAGGLYCVECRVEGSEFKGNTAPHCRDFVVDGLFLNNNLDTQTGYMTRLAGEISVFALRGSVFGNHFGNRCGAVPPFGVFFGPSDVGFNTFSDHLWDLCGDLALISLQGPVNFFNNSLSGVRLQVCRQHQLAGHDDDSIRVYNNLLESGSAAYPEMRFCEDRLDSGPSFAIDPANVEFAFNLGHPIALWGPGGGEACVDCVHDFERVGYCPVDTDDNGVDFDFRLQPDSPALPHNEPLTPAPLGAVWLLCGEEPDEDDDPKDPKDPDEDPVIVQSSRVARMDGFVALEWNISGVEIKATRIERTQLPSRDTVVQLDLLYDEGCDSSCYHADRTADSSLAYEYQLCLELADGSERTLLLGSVGSSGSPAKLRLGQLRPNPTPDGFSVTFWSPTTQRVSLELLDASGRRIETLWDGVVAAGPLSVECSAKSQALSAGIYWLRLKDSQGALDSQRLTILR